MEAQRITIRLNRIDVNSFGKLGGFWGLTGGLVFFPTFWPLAASLAITLPLPDVVRLALSWLLNGLITAIAFALAGALLNILLYVIGGLRFEYDRIAEPLILPIEQKSSTPVEKPQSRRLPNEAYQDDPLARRARQMDDREPVVGESKKRNHYS